MKKTICMFILMIALAGCSQDREAEKADAAEAKSVAISDSNPPAEYLEGYMKNPQLPDDRELVEPDQIIEDSKGRSTLIKMNQVNQVYKMWNIELTIRDAKLIHLRPAYSMIDYFHGLTAESEFDYIKFFVEVNNTSSQNLQFSPIAQIETNHGEQVHWEDDVYLEGIDELLQPGQSRKGNMGFIIEKADNLSSITITTSDVYDEEGNKVTDAQTIEIEI
ncbi:hypothetical protein [Oceanobacillus sp. J11TS1]|uniref:hypothetical protein n=1 Tax=Oceanobacillus sp. J11TS1 TaxID=2807191 RepID=UPI001B1DF6E1|nr:hypothetical protein [Oceanobacillus sp. J11TS1]GIO21451.1 hypothetical protein J11TS1_00320 [Oceanobacillus sp. J11TS1]